MAKLPRASKKLRFAYILYLILIGALTIAAISYGDYFEDFFMDGIWPIGTSFDLAFFSIEETVIYALLPILIYWIWHKLED